MGIAPYWGGSSAVGAGGGVRNATLVLESGLDLDCSALALVLGWELALVWGWELSCVWGWELGWELGWEQELCRLPGWHPGGQFVCFSAGNGSPDGVGSLSSSWFPSSSDDTDSATVEKCTGVSCDNDDNVLGVKLERLAKGVSSTVAVSGATNRGVRRSGVSAKSESWSSDSLAELSSVLVASTWPFLAAGRGPSFFRILELVHSRLWAMHPLHLVASGRKVQRTRRAEHISHGFPYFPLLRVSVGCVCR